MALVHNELLVGSDLIHPEGERCLFQCPDQIQDYALEIEGFAVCGACWDFYRCLKCEYELEQVDAYVQGLLSV